MLTFPNQISTVFN